MIFYYCITIFNTITVLLLLLLLFFLANQYCDSFQCHMLYVMIFVFMIVLIIVVVAIIIIISVYILTYTAIIIVIALIMTTMILHNTGFFKKNSHRPKSSNMRRKPPDPLYQCCYVSLRNGRSKTGCFFWRLRHALLSHNIEIGEPGVSNCHR